MIRSVWFVAVLGCSSSAKPATVPANGGGGGAGAETGAIAGDCAGARAKVEQLYRTEAQAKEPKRVEEAVADNTAMVMADCAKDPAVRARCLAKAASVAELEKQCLIPLDPEGTEGEQR